MIIATAGHVDHGKTLLVKALTGIDADRLAEEKRRGMTIDLGFANRPVGNDGMLAFIDVPGHENFIHNMISGVTAIEFALVIVAADDGPMPQTKEHLAILDLLRVTAGAIVITKIDTVTPERVGQVGNLMRELLADTTLKSAPFFEVSSLTSQGIAALLAYLEKAEITHQNTPVQGCFRLAIDRHFQMKGAGLIVAGAIQSGRIQEQDHCMLAPLGTNNGQHVRIRSLEKQGRPSREARMGERCSLNITGAMGDNIDPQTIHRGLWLTHPKAALPAQRLDIRLRLLNSEEHALRFWTAVHIHIGATDITGRIALLEGRSLAPGANALAQLVLDHPVIAAHGDLVIIRDQSAKHTMGGGPVIDPFTPQRGRARPERLRKLTAMEISDPANALSALLAQSPEGVDLFSFERAFNLDDTQLPALQRALAMITVKEGASERAFSPEHWQNLRVTTRNALAHFHQQEPEKLGLSLALLKRNTALRFSDGIFSSLLSEMERAGEIKRSGALISLAGHQVHQSKQEAALWTKLKPLLDKGPTPPRIGELAQMLNRTPEALEVFLRRAEAQALVVRVCPNRVYLPAQLAKLAALADKLSKISKNGRFEVGIFRDHSGVSRNLATEILEYFDRAGITKRIGNEREFIGRLEEIAKRTHD